MPKHSYNFGNCASARFVREAINLGRPKSEVLTILYKIYLDRKKAFLMPKDILLYMSDQHSYRLQGYAGNPVIRTPNLDRLAQNGVAMTNAMTACPLCVPARTAMISGQLPSNNGVLFNSALYRPIRQHFCTA